MYKNYLYIKDIGPLWCKLQIFSPNLPFCLLLFFFCHEVFFNCYDVVLIFLQFWILSHSWPLPLPDWKGIHPCFLLVLISLHLGLIHLLFNVWYVCGMRHGSKFIFFQMAIQLSLYHLLESIFALMTWDAPFIFNQISICIWAFSWPF